MRLLSLWLSPINTLQTVILQTGNPNGSSKKRQMRFLLPLHFLLPPLQSQTKSLYILIMCLHHYASFPGINSITVVEDSKYLQC